MMKVKIIAENPIAIKVDSTIACVMESKALAKHQLTPETMA